MSGPSQPTHHTDLIIFKEAKDTLLSDLPTCTHFAYSVRILTHKYACTNCCSPGTHFVALRSSPVSVSMQVQIYEVDPQPALLLHWNVKFPECISK